MQNCFEWMHRMHHCLPLGPFHVGCSIMNALLLGDHVGCPKNDVMLCEVIFASTCLCACLHDSVCPNTRKKAAAWSTPGQSSCTSCHHSRFFTTPPHWLGLGTVSCKG